MNADEVQKGARVVISAVGRAVGIDRKHPHRVGVIRSQRENFRHCIWILWEGAKCAESYHLNFLDVVAPPSAEG